MSIALLFRDRLVLGVVLAPNPPIAGCEEDLIAWAEGTGPATRNGRPVRRVWADGLSAQQTVLLAVGADRWAEVHARRVEPARFRAVNSVAYRMALVAVGEGECGVTLAAATDYDFAAAHAILRGVGGDLVGADGRPIRYGLESGGVVDAGGRCFGGGVRSTLELSRRDWVSTRGEAPVRGLCRPSPARIFTGDRRLLDRAQGLMLGLVASDSWCATGMRDGDLLAGQPTARTEGALLLARALLAEDGFVPNSLRDLYARWSEVSEAEEVGPLYRAPPLALAASKGQADRWAREDAALTHGAGPAPANAVWVSVLQDVVRTGEPAVGRRAERLFAWGRDLAELAEASDVQAGVEAAYRLNGCRLAVLTGAVLGARFGASRLPWRWVDRVLTCRPARSSPRPRPPEVWPVDLLVVAEQLLHLAGRGSVS